MQKPQLGSTSAQPFSWEMDSNSFNGLHAAESAWVAAYHEAGHILAALQANQPPPDLRFTLTDRSRGDFSWDALFKSSGSEQVDLMVAVGGPGVELSLRHQHHLRSDPTDIELEVFSHSTNDRTWMLTTYPHWGPNAMQGPFWPAVETFADVLLGSPQDIALIDCFAYRIYDSWRLHDFDAAPVPSISGEELVTACS
jgi:hypothetical protein